MSTQIRETLLKLNNIKSKKSLKEAPFVGDFDASIAQKETELQNKEKELQNKEKELQTLRNIKSKYQNEDPNLFIYTGTEKVPKSVRKVIINDNLTEIPAEAFEKRFSLSEVTIPNSIKSIGEAAFLLCKNLKNINIPNSVESIGEFAFSECMAFTDITIPNSVTSIGDYAFFKCTNLKSINIPNSVTSLDGHTLQGCPNLTITCPKGSYAEQYAEENDIPVKLIESIKKSKNPVKEGCKNKKKVVKESLTSDEISDICGKAAEALDDVLSHQEIFDNEFFTEHDLKVTLDCQELMAAAAYEFQGGSTFIYDDQSELTEDTIKTSKGKWVNKGDTGETHGTFKTKKEADAQRKAMFAQGYKVKEDLGSEEQLSRNDIKQLLDVLGRERIAHMLWDHALEDPSYNDLMHEIFDYIDNYTPAGLNDYPELVKKLDAIETLEPETTNALTKAILRHPGFNDFKNILRSEGYSLAEWRREMGLTEPCDYRIRVRF